MLLLTRTFLCGRCGIRSFYKSNLKFISAEMGSEEAYLGLLSSSRLAFIQPTAMARQFRRLVGPFRISLHLLVIKVSPLQPLIFLTGTLSKI